MTRDLSKPVAMVTGAANGIGAAVVDALAGSWQIIAVDVLSFAARDSGSSILPVFGDVSESKFWEALKRGLPPETCDRISCLVNCAGVLLEADADVSRIDEVVFSKTLSTNVLGTLNAIRFCLPALRGQPNSSIINIGSIVGLVGSNRSQICYTASKGSIAAITREIAVCEAAYNVRVNCISPGLIATEMTSRLVDAEAATKRGIPMARIGKASEVASVAAFLCSSAASYITGAEIVVDGGLSITNSFTAVLQAE